MHRERSWQADHFEQPVCHACLSACAATLQVRGGRSAGRGGGGVGMTPGRSPAYGLLASPHPSRGPQQPVMASPGRQGSFGGGPGGPAGAGVYSGRISTQQVRQGWWHVCNGGCLHWAEWVGSRVWLRAGSTSLDCTKSMPPMFTVLTLHEPAPAPPFPQDKMLEGRSITIRKGPFRGMRGRVISATATHVRLELEAQMKTVTVDRWVGTCAGPNEFAAEMQASGGVVRQCVAKGSMRWGRGSVVTTPCCNAPGVPGRQTECMSLHFFRSHLALEDGGRAEAAPRPGFGYPAANTPMAAAGRTPMHPGELLAFEAGFDYAGQAPLGKVAGCPLLDCTGGAFHLHCSCCHAAMLPCLLSRAHALVLT